jgi:transcriptional regulator with XRE-family HTH domain
MEMSFGARLRQQREERQVALEDISAKTKIKASLLEGLEADDLSRWPQGIFRRAYVRAYAQAIGLEPDVVVRRFLALYPEPEEEVPLVAPESPKRPPTRLRFLLSAAFGAASRLTAADNREGTDGRVGHMSHVTHPYPVERVDQLEPIEVAELVEAADLAGEPADLVPPFTRPPLSSVADLCTRIGRVSTLSQLELPLADAVRMLNAVGAVLWMWEAHKAALRARVSCGYAEDVLARFPLVGRDADNAIGVAYRSGQTAIVDGSDGETGAVAIPLLGPQGCVAVLALEVRHGDERNLDLHAIASIVAAQFVSLCVPPALAEAVNA